MNPIRDYPPSYSDQYYPYEEYHNYPSYPHEISYPERRYPISYSDRVNTYPPHYNTIPEFPYSEVSPPYEYAENAYRHPLSSEVHPHIHHPENHPSIEGDIILNPYQIHGHTEYVPHPISLTYTNLKCPSCYPIRAHPSVPISENPASKPINPRYEPPEMYSRHQFYENPDLFPDRGIYTNYTNENYQMNPINYGVPFL